MELTTKLTLLKEETRRHEEVEKTNTNLTTKLAALCEQMDKAKANSVATFQISHSFFNKCGVFHGKGFDGCLK